MKKLFLLFMILGLTSISFIESNAYAYQGITLDTPIADLQYESLRTLFESNLISQGDLFGDVDSIGNYSEGIYTNTMDGTNSSAYAQYSNAFDLNDLYYYRLSLNVEYSNADYILVARGINNVPRYDNPEENIVYSLSDYGIPTQYDYLRIVHSASSYQDTQGLNLSIKIRNMYVINLTDYGFTINDTNKETLDYYYNLYYLLINGLNPTEYYLDGSVNGYIEGYNDGVEDGYSDGYNNGYSDGQEDGYDTGYLDGNVAGLETGYFNGYNDGYDEGVISDVDTQWLLGFVSGAVNILGVSIIPGISLGVFVFIPLFLGFIGFIFRLGGRRG
jgi:hypothetical protein